MMVYRLNTAPKKCGGGDPFGPARGAYSPAPAPLLDLREASPMFFETLTPLGVNRSLETTTTIIIIITYIHI